MSFMPYGFRIVGGCHRERRLVDAGSALQGYASCSTEARVDREGYLSAFQFGSGFRDHLESTGSTRGYDGPCWSPWLWFDIDCPGDLGEAQKSCQRLVCGLIERYSLHEDHLVAFFSGSKGFHVGLPTSLWRPEPTAEFNAVSKAMAQRLAALLEVNVDAGIYDKVRALRAPNSKHPRTGLRKRIVEFDELLKLPPQALVELARGPRSFDWPQSPPANETAHADWVSAQAENERQRQALMGRRTRPIPERLNAITIRFIREGADVGDRHRFLFSAAANLAEIGCNDECAWALLNEAALDCGLSPSEIRRTVTNGCVAGRRNGK
jgi:hypothetical protein